MEKRKTVESVALAVCVGPIHTYEPHKKIYVALNAAGDWLDVAFGRTPTEGFRALARSTKGYDAKRCAPDLVEAGRAFGWTEATAEDGLEEAAVLVAYGLVIRSSIQCDVPLPFLKELLLSASRFWAAKPWQDPRFEEAGVTVLTKGKNFSRVQDLRLRLVPPGRGESLPGLLFGSDHDPRGPEVATFLHFARPREIVPSVIDGLACFGLDVLPIPLCANPLAIPPLPMGLGDLADLNVILDAITAAKNRPPDSGDAHTVQMDDIKSSAEVIFRADVERMPVDPIRAAWEDLRAADPLNALLMARRPARGNSKSLFDIRVGPASDDCEICRSQASPKDLVKRMGGSAASVPDQGEGHWEEFIPDGGELEFVKARMWVPKNTADA